MWRTHRGLLTVRAPALPAQALPGGGMGGGRRGPLPGINARVGKKLAPCHRCSSAGFAGAIPSWGEASEGGRSPPPSFLWEVVTQPPPAEPMPLPVPGPVDQEGLAADLLALDEAPVAAVLGVVAVVTHDEIRAGGNAHRLAGIRVATVCGQRRVEGAGTHVRLVLDLAVQPDAVVAHLDRVAADADDALDEVAGFVVRVLEDDDVAALGSAEPGQVHVGERDLGAVEELVDEDV